MWKFANRKFQEATWNASKTVKDIRSFLSKEASHKERLIRWGMLAPHSTGLPEEKFSPNTPIPLPHCSPWWLPKTTELKSPGQSMGSPELIFLSPLTSHNCWLRAVVLSAMRIRSYPKEKHDFSSTSVAGGKASLILGNNSWISSIVFVSKKVGILFSVHQPPCVSCWFRVPTGQGGVVSSALPSETVTVQ